MGKSIKDVAELLGVSKTAVRKYMDADFREKYTTIAPNGAIYIETEGVTLLQTKCNSSRKQEQTSENQGVETSANQIAPSLVAALVAQLDVKDKQIAEQQKIIEEQQRQIADLTQKKSLWERLFGKKDALILKGE